jgi:hypothetical protein
MKKLLQKNKFIQRIIKKSRQWRLFLLDGLSFVLN